ncbi:hypothetical protein WN943_003248 [Citrus x changshan-huyou]
MRSIVLVLDFSVEILARFSIFVVVSFLEALSMEDLRNFLRWHIFMTIPKGLNSNFAITFPLNRTRTIMSSNLNLNKNKLWLDSLRLVSTRSIILVEILARFFDFYGFELLRGFVCRGFEEF